MDNSNTVFNITSAQMGVWIKQKFSPDGFLFDLAEYIEIHGPVDPAVFCQSLKQLSLEVEATRTKIVEQEGMPVQVVSADVTQEFEVLDFSCAAIPFQAAQQWMNRELRRGDRQALWGSTLLRLAEDHWIWYHHASHVVLDGYSGGMMARRMAEIYTAFKRNIPLTPTPFGGLGDALAVENAYRQSAQFARDRDFWKSRLEGIKPPVTLSRRSGPVTGGLLRHRSSLDREQVRLLETLGKRVGCTLPQCLMALVAAYYARATDCAELTMATMVTSRISAEARSIPVMMANGVPLRFTIDEKLTWLELVQQVSQQMKRALRYQRYRYEDMRRDLAMAHQDDQIARLGVNIEPFDYDLRFDGHPTTVHNLSNGTMSDFTIFAYDRGDGGNLTVDFDANPGLYTLADLMTHEKRFSRLLESVIAAPDQAISSFPLLSAQERTDVLEGWNDTGHVLKVSTWLELFEAQVQRVPDALAVRFADCDLTYAELDREAGRWARVLRHHGIGAGDLVAVAVPRSHIMLVAMIAIHRAGAAYLPIDHQDPAQRLRMILEEAKPNAVLTVGQVRAQLPAISTAYVMMDEPAPDLPDMALEPVKGSDTAYVIFTSGSTGRPKGVEISHLAFSNFLQAMQDVLGLTVHDRIAAVTTVAFDIAGLELFLPLTVGGATVIASRDVVKDPAALIRLIEKNRISILQATPSLWRSLTHEFNGRLYGLRPLVGGEALPADLARKMAQLGHPVLNVYGPTETTVWSTVMELCDADLDTVPIGRPIWNTQVYVLDRFLQPVPVGVPGELYIGGLGVAKGYLHRPDLTRERFLENPFRQDGSRIYKTGDLARWREDGVLEYLGRNDDQVKIRGFRIEPREIEMALLALEDVREAVVVARGESAERLRLVAYITAQSGRPIETRQLADRLSASLPPHMIPAEFMVLDALPLNTNGKVDRKALPEPKRLGTRLHIPPQTDMEKAIARIWCEVLHLETVGIEDNFFDLGGDSMAAALMASCLQKQLGGDVSLASFLDNPTVANLARAVGKNARKPRIEPVLHIRARGDEPPLFCVHPILGLGWKFSSLATAVNENIPLHAFQTEQFNADMEPLRSIEEMATHYCETMLRLQPEGPYRLLGWSMGGLIAHEMARHLAERGHRVSFLAMLDSYPFKPVGPDEPQREDLMVRAALGFLGFPEDALGHEASIPALSRYLETAWERDVVIQELNRASPVGLARAWEVILHHIELCRRFIPKTIDVDIHFFKASPMKAPSIQEILQYQAQVWEAHTTGRVEITRVAAGHEEMLNAVPARQIGKVLNAALMNRRDALPASPVALDEPSLAYL